LWFFFSPMGRINRGAYWLQKVVMLILIFAVHFNTIPHRAAPVLLIVAVWSYLVVDVKRWHDLGRSGWWVFVDAIPILGPIYSFLLLGFAEGNRDENPYGAPPAGIP
jgi:uncharacterized membrane protein YhaH (DUF805 family)